LNADRPQVTGPLRATAGASSRPAGRRLRIALVGPGHPFRGGIAHHTTLLARHLRTRHDVLFVSLSRQYPRWLFPGRTDRDPSEAPLAEPAERLLAPLAPTTWWRSGRRVAAFEPDLVVLPWWSPVWAPCLAVVARLCRRWTNARVVFVCHNVLPHEGGGLAARLLVRLALGQGDAFIVHSAADEASLGRLLGGHAARCPVRRGVLPSLAVAAPDEGAPAAARAAARRRLGLPANGSVALFFGFVRPYKGLAVLIEALPLVLPRVPDLRLLVAGEFWEPAHQHMARAGALGVAGHVSIDDRYVPNEEVGAYFAAADLVVLPYLEASQSGVVTQAAAFGLPAVASRVGGLPDSIVDGVTGLLVPPGDAVALADAIARVLTEPGLSGRLRAGVLEARSRFEWPAAVRLIESLAPAPEEEGLPCAPA
jgi:glycosyltransferase involved in cell wall biosynthesis